MFPEPSAVSDIEVPGHIDTFEEALRVGVGKTAMSWIELEIHPLFFLP